MTVIDKSSEKISKIGRVIDELAFQTNILALNVAVEAPCAGEAGIGFAAAAEAVRNKVAHAVARMQQITSPATVECPPTSQPAS